MGSIKSAEKVQIRLSFDKFYLLYKLTRMHLHGGLPCFDQKDSTPLIKWVSETKSRIISPLTDPESMMMLFCLSHHSLMFLLVQGLDLS